MACISISSSIFRISRYAREYIICIDNDHWFFFFFFFFYLRLVNLEPRCKFQRVLRPKKEEAKSRRGPANCHRRGQLPMVSHFLDSLRIQRMGNHFCYYFVIVLILVICSSYYFFFYYIIWPMHAGLICMPSRSSYYPIQWAFRDFVLVLRKFIYGLI